MPAPFTTPVAVSVPFIPGRNPDYNGGVGILTAQNCQDAIEEVYSKAPGSQAKPGFTWGASGNTPTGTYLLNDTVPSNLTGRIVPFTGVITAVFVSSQNADTFNVTVQKRVGASFVDLVTINVVATRKTSAIVNVAIALNEELACRITSGAAKNPVVGLLAAGS